jgi:hypothetical protein
MKNGGSSLLDSCYSKSLSRALQCVYPEYNWQLWRFVRVPNKYWEKDTHQRQFLDWLTVRAVYIIIASDIELCD